MRKVFGIPRLRTPGSGSCFSALVMVSGSSFRRRRAVIVDPPWGLPPTGLSFSFSCSVVLVAQRGEFAMRCVERQRDLGHARDRDL